MGSDAGPQNRVTAAPMRRGASPFALSAMTIVFGDDVRATPPAPSTATAIDHCECDI